MFSDMRAGFFAVFLLPTLILGGAGTTRAAAEARPVMSEGEYAEALTFIEGTKSVMRDAGAALGTETSRAEAETRKADLGQRLAMLRRLMTAAAQRDRIGARGHPKNRGVTPERERARDVIQRAGAIEDPLQDLWTAWSRKARGLPAEAGRTGLTTAPPLPR